MHKLILASALVAPFMFSSPSGAFVGQPSPSVVQQSLGSPHLIEVKGGRGRGHGWGRGHGRRHFGWSRGRKVGWRGHHCPPGHARKGWC